MTFLFIALGFLFSAFMLQFCFQHIFDIQGTPTKMRPAPKPALKRKDVITSDHLFSDSEKTI